MDELKQYERYLRINRKAEGTIYQYVNDVKLFLGITGIDPVKCKSEHIEEFMEELVIRKCQNSTVVRKIAALRHFYGFLLNREYVKENHFASVPKLRIPRKDMPILSGPEVTDIFNALESCPESLEGRRTVSMFHVMYYLGLRVAEVAGLNLSSIVGRPERQLRFTGKGGKERLLPLVNEKLVISLDEWLEFRERFKGIEALYITHTRNKLSRISVKTIQRWMNWLGKEAGISGSNLTPHVIRRTFGTRLLEAGADIFSVSDLLGHESIVTTRRYAQVTPAKRKETLCLL